MINMEKYFIESIFKYGFYILIFIILVMGIMIVNYTHILKYIYQELIFYIFGVDIYSDIWK